MPCFFLHLVNLNAKTSLPSAPGVQYTPACKADERTPSSGGTVPFRTYFLKLWPQCDVFCGGLCRSPQPGTSCCSQRISLHRPSVPWTPASTVPEAQETLIQCGETKGVRSRDGDQGAQTYLTRQAGVKTRSAPAPASQEDGGLSGERGREQGGGGGGRTCLRTGSVCQWEFRGFFQWKDCLTEQLEAGRAWKGGDRGGLSRRVSLGAQ